MRGAYAIRCADGVYVGGSAHINDRFAQHRYLLRHGKHRNRRLLEAWERLGEQAFTFEVLELSETEDLLAVEQRWIDRLSADGSLFNVHMVAGSSAGSTHTPETRAKMAAAQLGTVFSHERRANISAAKKGAKTASTKITEDQVREIRRRFRNGETHRGIAAACGISQATVFDIVHGRRWAHVADAVNDDREAERNDPTPPASMAQAA